MQASPNIHLDMKHMTESLSIENHVLIYLEQNQRRRNFKARLGMHTLNVFVSSVFGRWSITTFSFFPSQMRNICGVKIEETMTWLALL